MKRIRSVKLWLALIVAPFILMGCAAWFVNFDSGFDHDEYVSRTSIAAPGVRSLSYIYRGDPDGQRVIFVHGTPGDAGAWYDMVKNVPKGYLFIAVDRPGFGQTRPDKAMVSLSAQAAALEPLLHTKNGRKPILVGHSLGGPIVVEAAAKYPDLIGGVVVVAGALNPALEDVRFYQYVGDVPPFSWMIGTELRHTNEELIALEGELDKLKPKLAGIRVPVAILHGTKDELVPYANVAYMEKMMTGTRPEVTTLKGMNHFLPWTAPDVILKAVEKVSTEAALPKADAAR